jgi:hypothetical protein
MDKIMKTGNMNVSDMTQPIASTYNGMYDANTASVNEAHHSYQQVIQNASNANPMQFNQMMQAADRSAALDDRNKRWLSQQQQNADDSLITGELIAGGSMLIGGAISAALLLSSGPAGWLAGFALLL